MQDALEVALRKGCKSAISQLLEYSIDLNIILSSDAKTQTPLEWASEHEDLNLVELFLSKGAEADFTSATFTRNPALIKAVEKANERLVKILVPKTNRVLSTRALCLAVGRKNIAIVNILLEHGVCCDFVDGDQQPSKDASDWRTEESAEARAFTPPLVRAVIMGDIELTRVLLVNGADVNVGYHDIGRDHGRPLKTDIPCGRVIQVAMQLKFHEIVDLLLEFGADINLPQPVWAYHQCKSTPRNVYLKTTSGLRAASASLEQRK
ncbi:hypothetical protein OCU04_007227 [Sclerotinia nivalis]|uniref:Ankyrin n=1 Tax=Sclerotinia nivalis TaxID=352851 RepID=A0A9X0DLB6_9HELO|nr:hypothetical protein OCU04_007227 [Sclerotinia nivalis]